MFGIIVRQVCPTHIQGMHAFSVSLYPVLIQGMHVANLMCEHVTMGSEQGVAAAVFL
jgi:hypothetical protein